MRTYKLYLSFYRPCIYVVIHLDHLCHWKAQRKFGRRHWLCVLEYTLSFRDQKKKSREKSVLPWTLISTDSLKRRKTPFQWTGVMLLTRKSENLSSKEELVHWAEKLWMCSQLLVSMFGQQIFQPLKTYHRFEKKYGCYVVYPWKPITSKDWCLVCCVAMISRSPHYLQQSKHFHIDFMILIPKGAKSMNGFLRIYLGSYDVNFFVLFF